MFTRHQLPGCGALQAGAACGVAPRRSSSPPSNGWTGSTTGACSSPSAIFFPPKKARYKAQFRQSCHQPPTSCACTADVGDSQSRISPIPENRPELLGVLRSRAARFSKTTVFEGCFGRCKNLLTSARRLKSQLSVDRRSSNPFPTSSGGFIWG